MKRKISLSWLVGLLLVFLVYSSASILMKLSSSEDNSVLALFYLAGTFGVLGVYAFFWQMILKHIPLSTAFMFKSITVLYGMFFATAIFDENITRSNLAGAFLIVLGIVILGWK